MPKLNINGYKVSYDAIDCKDKILVFKIPHAIFNNCYALRNQLSEVSKELMKAHGAKRIITMVTEIDYETMDTDQAINMINDCINELNKIKEVLLEENEENEE